VLKIKKIACVLLSVLLTSVFLAACVAGENGGGGDLPPSADEPASVSITAPAASVLGAGVYALTAAVLPAGADQSVTFGLVGTAPVGVTLTGTAVTIAETAQNGARFTVKVTSAAKNTVTGTKEFTVDIAAAADPRPGVGNVEYEAYQWKQAPVVKNVFFDDFAAVTNANWHLVDQRWGGNGVSPNNVYYSTNPLQVSANGGGDGIMVLESYGNYAALSSKRRQGACLISSDSYGAGFYEVRMKVVPRFGPCSAVWPYYTNSVMSYNTPDNIQYTEIDIECPAGGKGFNAWGGVTYEEYYYNSNNGDRLVNKSRGVTALCESPYNDGQWHIFALEWRYNPETEDVGVIWYMDGKRVAEAFVYVPYYTAQLWIGNWFPGEQPNENVTNVEAWVNQWLGIADFDRAYMYVDWVRITEYDDPVTYAAPNLGGCIGAGSAATNLRGEPIPANNYITNGSFTQPGSTTDSARAWTLTSASRTGAGEVRVEAGGRMRQDISAQYNGYRYDLNVTAAAGAGGTVKVYVEYYKYPYAANSNHATSAVITGAAKIGQSSEIVFDSATSAAKTLSFAIPAGTPVDNIRVIIESAGAAGTVTQVEMFMVPGVV
jgi:hypothetical protein